MALWNEFMASRDKLQHAILLAGGFAIGITGSMVWQGRSDTSNVHPHIHPDGTRKTIKTGILEGGAYLFQSKAPLQGFNIYLVGFHPMVEDPCHQMEAHHFCKQVNEDFAQCILCDGNTHDANITGIEYIISEKLFQELTAEEKKFWHPHNYEILSGLLSAPGLPKIAEKSLMKTKMNSYGKTIHTWRAKCWEGNQPYLDTLPLGKPLLGWSFNHNGEIRDDLVIGYEMAFNRKTNDTQQQRQSLVAISKPQEGVDKLLPYFKEPEKITCLHGVVDVSEEN